ncbi:MAG: hypothetical protein WC966_04795 [Bradymonadales bacterium]
MTHYFLIHGALCARALQAELARARLQRFMEPNFMSWKYSRIAVLCSGNICRSPLAEHLLRKKLAEQELNAQVISMGTLGLQGRSADPQIVRIAKEYGCDVSRHRSQGVSRAILEATDVILIMDGVQERMLRQYAPQIMNKVQRLGVFLEPPQDEIDDPVGLDAATFRRVASEIDAALDAWISSSKLPQ